MIKKRYVRELKKEYPDKPRECLHCQLFLRCKSYKIPHRLLHKGGDKVILLVLMNPGANEDRLNKILVGKSGKLLMTYVETYFNDHTVYATNAVKCYNGEGDNKVELAKEHSKQCSIYLKEDIETIKPDVIISMGKVAQTAMEILDE